MQTEEAQNELWRRGGETADTQERGCLLGVDWSAACASQEAREARAGRAAVCAKQLWLSQVESTLKGCCRVKLLC